jgi:hypothetical protein
MATKRDLAKIVAVTFRVTSKNGCGNERFALITRSVMATVTTFPLTAG